MRLNRPGLRGLFGRRSLCTGTACRISSGKRSVEKKKMLVALRAGTRASTRAPLFAWRASLGTARTPNCCARRGAGLLSLHLMLVAAGLPRPSSSFASSLGAGLVLCLGRCGLQPLLPSLPVGSTLLAFSAARACASLLGLSLPGTANVDGDQQPLRRSSACCQPSSPASVSCSLGLGHGGR